MRFCTLISSLLLLLVSCTTTASERPHNGGSAAPVVLSARRAFEVWDERSLVGHVVQFRALESQESIYSVRNPWHQELGQIDSLGRCWRFRPHAEEAEWLGSGPVVDGARLILGASLGARLVEVPLTPSGSMLAAQQARSSQP